MENSPGPNQAIAVEHGFEAHFHAKHFHQDDVDADDASILQENSNIHTVEHSLLEERSHQAEAFVREEEAEQEAEEEEEEEEDGPRPCRHNKWTPAGRNGLLCAVCRQLWVLHDPTENACPDFEASHRCHLGVHCPLHHIVQSFTTKKKNDETDMEQDAFFTSIAAEVLTNAEAAARAAKKKMDGKTDGPPSRQSRRMAPSLVELEIHRTHLRRLHLRGGDGHRPKSNVVASQPPLEQQPKDAGEANATTKTVVEQPSHQSAAVPPKKMPAPPSPADASVDVAGFRIINPNPGLIKSSAAGQKPLEQIMLHHQLQQNQGRLSGYLPTPQVTVKLPPPPPPFPKPPISSSGKLGGVALPGFHPPVGTIHSTSAIPSVVVAASKERPAASGHSQQQPQLQGVSPPWLEFYKGKSNVAVSNNSSLLPSTTSSGGTAGFLSSQLQPGAQHVDPSTSGVVVLTTEQYQSWASASQ
jgi:hypothetical protein